MTAAALVPHPATPMPQVESLRASLARTEDGGFRVRFDCRCPPGALRLPQAGPAGRADELWRRTCCELFAGAAGRPAYREFNWSPSGQWAVYDFSDYRTRAPADPDACIAHPHIEFGADAAGWTLQAQVDRLMLSQSAAAQVEIGIAVVLEAADGSLSYWALRHADVRPDFHRRETFALPLCVQD